MADEEFKLTPDEITRAEQQRERENRPAEFVWNEENGWLDLWGIESPALTASLAIGEYVKDVVVQKL